MLDPKLLKENPSVILEMLKKRKFTFPFEELVSLDKRRRDLMVETQEIRREKNIITEYIASKKKIGHDTTTDFEKIKEISIRLSKLEHELTGINEKFQYLVMLLPNVLHETVPIGNDENDNKVIKKAGTFKRFDFKPKDHVDLVSTLELVDLERAAKTSGARFYYLKNELVLLNQALIRFALDYLSVRKYTVIQPPYMIRKNAMEGAVILCDFEDSIYKIENEDLYLIGTSEHALAAMYMNEILDGSKLPSRFAGFSPCFRREAGAHGKDMKGIFRVHQFEKVEQFVFSRPEDSWQEHERMLANSETFYEQLGIPFQVVLLCTADTGKISAKTYDIEAWMAGQNAYREIVSCSNCLDYQARRLAIRFRDRTNDDTRLVHTLNSTLVATERTLVAIVEYYQTAKGTIEVPTVLRPYMGDIREIRST